MDGDSMKKLLTFFIIISFLFMIFCSNKQESTKTISPSDNEAAEDIDSAMDDIDTMINDVSREDINIDLR